MTNTITDTLRAALETLGRTACAAGDSADPALDPTVQTIIKDKGVNFVSDAFDAFADGYDAQRLREQNA